MRVALHTDQLWFSAPGGIGTYVRELSSALRALEDAPDLLTFQVGAGDGSADEVVTGSIRSIYPRWDVTGRPALPFDCDVVHATNHAAIPPPPPARRSSPPCTTSRSTSSRRRSHRRGGGCTEPACARRPGAPT